MRPGFRALCRLLLCAAALLLTASACAQEAAGTLLEGMGFDQLQVLSDEVGGPDVRGIAEQALSGSLDIPGDLPRRALRRLGDALGKGLAEAAGLLAVPVLASALLGLLGGRDGALALLCRLACACALMTRAAVDIEAVGKALGEAARVARGTAPVLTAALALTGLEARSALLSPEASLCAGAIEDVLSGVALPACGLAAAVAASGSLSRRFSLSRLFALLRRAVSRGVALLVAGFAGLMALQGSLAAAQDTASARAVGAALKSLVPLIGRQVSASASALLSSAAAARGAVGVTGIALAFTASAGPLVRLWTYALSIRLAAAVAEPVADPCVAGIASDFADVAQMLLAVGVAGALLAALLAGTCLGG